MKIFTALFAETFLNENLFNKSNNKNIFILILQQKCINGRNHEF